MTSVRNLGEVAGSPSLPAATKPLGQRRVVTGTPRGDGLSLVSERLPDDCPVEVWLERLGHRWTALILWHLSCSSHRTETLRNCLPGISTKVLSERLRSLCQLGLIDRQSSNSFPRTVTYQLTARGSRLANVLDGLERWVAADAAGD